MSAGQTNESKWWLKTADGTQYGPVGLPTLCLWAADARVGPGCAVSPDGERWMAAQELEPLRMDWFVEVREGMEYGPLNLLAVADLVREGSVRLGARLRHARQPGQQAVDHRFPVLVLEESRAMLAAVAGMAEEPVARYAAAVQALAASVEEAEKRRREVEAGLEEAQRKIAALERAEAGQWADMHRRLAEAEKQADVLSALLDKERTESLAAREEIRRLKLALLQSESRLKERRELEDGERRRLEEERDRLARARDEALKEAAAAQARLQEQSQLLQTTQQEAEERLRAAMERAATAESRLAHVIEQARVEHAAAAALADRMANTDRRLVEALKQVEVLSDSLDKERTQAVALEAEVGRLKKALSEAEKQWREAQNQRREEEMQRRRLEEERDQLRRARDEALQEVTTVRSQALARSRELETALQKKEEQLQEVLERLAVVEQQRVQALEEASTARAKAEEASSRTLREELEAAEKKAEQLAKLLDVERERVVVAEAEVHRLKQALAAKEEGGEETERPLAADEAKRERDHERSVEQERDRLRQELRSLQEQLRTIEAARDHARMACEEAERQVREQSERIRQMEAERVAQEATWKAENRRLEDALESVREEWKRAETRLLEAQRTSEQLRGAMARGEQDLRERMDRMRAEFAAIVAGLEQAARRGATSRRIETIDAVDWLDGGRRGRAAASPPTDKNEAADALTQRVAGIAKEMQAALEAAHRAQQELAEYQARYEALEARYQEAMRANEEQTARLRAEIQTSADLLAQAMRELERRESEYRALRKRLDERADADVEVVDGPWEKIGDGAAQEGPSMQDKLRRVEAQAQAELKAWQRRRQTESREDSRKWFPPRKTEI